MDRPAERLTKETPMASRIVHCLVAGVACLAVISLSGCAGDHIARGYTAETRIDGRPVIYRSAAGHHASLKVHNQDTATFGVGQFKFTVDRTQVTWEQNQPEQAQSGQNQTLALPPNWRRVEFVEEETHVAIRVDGKALGEIRSAV